MSIEPSNIDFAELATRILDDEIAPAPRTNKKTRVSSWNGSLETLPAEKVTEAVALFDHFLVEDFGSVLQGTKPRTLEETEIVALADELGKSNTIAEIAASVKERAKKLVFDHSDESGNTGDFTIDVPGTNMRFRRSGTEPGEPTADWSRLNEVVDEDEDFDTLAPKRYTMSLSKEEYEYLMGRVNQGFRDTVKVDVGREVDKDAAMRYVMESTERQRKFAKLLTRPAPRDGAFYYESIPKGTK